jgi:hypothetical protein
VQRFHWQIMSEVILEHNKISANQISSWQISMQRRVEGRNNRLKWRATQCNDKDGPMMAPDVFSGKDTNCWPHEYRAATGVQSSSKIPAVVVQTKLNLIEDVLQIVLK